MQIHSANLTITTQHTARNLLDNIFGGGRSGAGIPNTIDGNIYLTIQNTDANEATGGSLSQGPLTSITGSIYVTISNSLLRERINGGSNAVLGGGLSYIGGSIHMNLDSITTP